MLLTVLLFSLGLCAVLFAIAHDVRVFRERVEVAYDYAKDVVPDYLTDEKDFIFEIFLPKLVSWKPQHDLFARVVNAAFVTTLLVTLGTMFLAAGSNVEPGFLLFVQAVDAALIGVYVSTFRPHKTMLYSKMNQFDARIAEVKEAAH